MKPGELYAGIPWHDGKVIYRGGGAAVPMAIAATDNDAAAIVTALASGGRADRCRHQLAPDERPNHPSIFCEKPSIARVDGEGHRCMEHLAAMVGASIMPTDHHPDLWPAVRRLLAAWNLPESDHRNWWIEHCVTDLAAMNSGYVSRLRDEDLPAYMRDALAKVGAWPVAGGAR